MDTRFPNELPGGITLGESHAAAVEASFRFNLQQANPAFSAALTHLDAAKAKTATARATLANITSAVYAKRNRLSTMPRTSGADRETTAFQLTLLLDAQSEAEETLEFEIDALSAAQAALERAIQVGGE